ncbi:unnamed protein product [Lathyrus sativus]|nr:unnamed protein product [Lathyrus sativus]
MNWKLLGSIATDIRTRNRSYYTSRTKTPSLHSKISPFGNPTTSVVPQLDDWVFNGNKVSVGELQRVVRDLRKRSRFPQALQVSEWMNKNGVSIFSPVEHAVHLDLIGKVHGFVSAQTYFNSLKEQDRNEKTYGALLNFYVRQHHVDKSLSHLKKMKELGYASSPLTYNNIMCLYTNIGQHENVAGVLSEMKENHVLPENFSYRICINSYGVRSDIEGMEMILKEMENQPHIMMDWNTYSVVANFYIKAGLSGEAIDALSKCEARLEDKDGEGYNHLISLYARLGKKNEVLRLWEMEKNACKRCINRDFITMLESLVKLEEFDEAEKILKEWESFGNCYNLGVPNVVIVGYSKKDFLERAEAILEDLRNKGKAINPNTWTLVASRYLHKGEIEKAFGCLKIVVSLYLENKKWKPNPRVIATLHSWIGDNACVEDAEALVSLLENVQKNIHMYHALIKAYVRADKEVDGVLDRMINLYVVFNYFNCTFFKRIGSIF